MKDPKFKLLVKKEGKKARGSQKLTVQPTDLSRVLGLIPDPESNRLLLDTTTTADIESLFQTLLVIKQQKFIYGPVNPDIWLELIPWHTLN